MSARLKAPVLTVDAAEMRKVDPRNVETLFGMWTVFSKCAEAMEQGRRYENLSWRLWNRETFCCASNTATPAPSSPVSATRPLLPRKRAPSPTELPPPAASLAPSAPSSSSSSASPSLSSSLLRPARSPADDVPELSVSVESAVSDRDSAETHTSPLDIELPAIRRLDSFDGRSRGHERHLTPYHLERMFNSIKTRKELQPLELSPSSRTLIVRPCKTELMPLQRTMSPAIAEITLAPASVEEQSQRRLRFPHPSPAAAAPLRCQEFSVTPHTAYEEHDKMPPPGGAPNELNDNDIDNDGRNIGRKTGGNSTSSNRAPSPMTAASTTTVKKNVFLLGDSSGEDESSLESHMRSSLRATTLDGPKAVPSERKQTSFNEEVVTRTIREEYDADEDKDGVFETDDDEDDDGDVVSESAIDDDDEDEEDEDDSSEWDSVTESGRSSVDEKPLFQRVDSQRPLTSRRSLLTNMLHQSQRRAAFAEAASQSSPVTPRRSRTRSPDGVSAADDDGAAVEDATDDGHPSRRRSRHGTDLPRSKPIVMPPSQLHPAALSPRTTRLNMMATELTESLRKNLLWERQQKNTTASAVLRRRHTAHDVAHDQPQESSSREASKNNSWNHYYFDLGLAEYHQKGW